MYYSNLKFSGFNSPRSWKVEGEVMKCKLFIVFIFLNAAVFAQSKERLLFKNFISLCNDYKRLPLQLTIDYKKTSNIILSESDTAAMQGIFSLQKSGAYIRFGAAEQIIADSIVLIVMDEIKQMVVTKGNINLAEQINKMISMPVKDSSLKTLSSTYRIEQNFLNKEIGTLRIGNKLNVYGTDIPFEVITMEYSLKTNEPIKIETTKRSLIKKPQNGDFKTNATIVSVKDQGEYLLKEDVSSYLFSNIKHVENKKLPVMLTDRLVKDGNEGFVPVKTYESYRLIVN